MVSLGKGAGIWGCLVSQQAKKVPTFFPVIFLQKSEFVMVVLIGAFRYVFGVLDWKPETRNPGTS